MQTDFSRLPTFKGSVVRYSMSSGWGCVNGWCVDSNVVPSNVNNGKSVIHRNSFSDERICSPLASSVFVNSTRSFPKSFNWNIRISHYTLREKFIIKGERENPDSILTASIRRPIASNTASPSCNLQYCDKSSAIAPDFGFNLSNCVLHESFSIFNWISFVALK